MTWKNRIIREAVEDPEIIDLNPHNYRIHPPAQDQALEDILSEVGWVKHVIINERTGRLVDGEERVLLARRAGQSVPVVYVDLSEDEESVVLASLDPLAALARIDGEKFRALQADIKTQGPALQQMIRDIADQHSPPPPPVELLGDEDEIPEDPEVVVVEPGEIWILGQHRLKCGDSTHPEDVASLLQDVEPHLMVTDPPYGVSYDADWRNRAERANGTPYGGRAIGKVSNDEKANWREAWSLFPGDIAYVWHAGIKATEVAETLEACHFEIRSQIIWAKNQMVISRGHYHWQHEPCWYAVRKGKTGQWHGGRSQTTLWTIHKPLKSETGHSTQKPVECMRRPILNHSSPGQVVYEPFSGSGTTIIACETERRSCYALEIDPHYCDIAIQRWQALTGQEAECNGETWNRRLSAKS